MTAFFHSAFILMGNVFRGKAQPVNAPGIKVVFHRNVLFSQSLDKSKRIPEGYRSILKSMPYKSLGHLVSHLFFQRHFLFKGFIRISQKIPDAFCMGNLLVRADHRITEDQSLGPEIFRSTACCFPHVGLLPEKLRSWPPDGLLRKIP